MNRYLVHWSFANGEVDYDSPQIVEAESSFKAADYIMQNPGVEVTEVDLLTPMTDGEWSRFERCEGGWKIKGEKE